VQARPDQNPELALHSADLPGARPHLPAPMNLQSLPLKPLMPATAAIASASVVSVAASAIATAVTVLAEETTRFQPTRRRRAGATAGKRDLPGGRTRRVDEERLSSYRDRVTLATRRDVLPGSLFSPLQLGKGRDLGVRPSRLGDNIRFNLQRSHFRSWELGNSTHSDRRDCYFGDRRAQPQLRSTLRPPLLSPGRLFLATERRQVQMRSRDNPRIRAELSERPAATSGNAPFRLEIQAARGIRESRQIPR